MTEIVPTTPNPPVRLENMTEDFLTNQRAENTRQTYSRALERFFEWCKANDIVPAAITLKQALLYRKNVEDNYAESSGALHISAIKAYYRMMHDIGVLPINVWAAVKGLKAPTVSQTKALGPDDLRRIYGAAEQESPRDLLVVRLLYEVPLRREEVAELRKDALMHGPQGWVLRVKGKGDKTADVGIKDDLAHALLAQAEQSTGPWVFPGREGEAHLHKRQINRIADKYGFHPHQLRHSHVTNAFEQGMEVHDISRTVRHSNINTTMRYFDQREAVRRSTSRRLAPVLGPKE